MADPLELPVNLQSLEDFQAVGDGLRGLAHIFSSVFFPETLRNLRILINVDS